MRVTSEARVFRGLDHRFYAEVPDGSHHEIHELSSPAFEYWLIRRMRSERRTLPSLEGLKRMIRTLEADAMAHGVVEPVAIRVAGGKRAPAGLQPAASLASDGEFAPVRDPGTAIYLDLGDATHEAVEIRAEGCRICSRPPVSFRRPPGVQPLPRPDLAASASIELLKKYVNIADSDFPLLLGWITAALRPVGPYPVLILSGEQGSAKSTMARVLRKLIDPSSAPLRALPVSQRDLMIEAHNSWLLAYDNVSTISTAQSDGLCRIATGGGFSTRALFTDHDSALLDALRPVIITGIDEFVRRGDLIDRCVFLRMPAIGEQNRQLEQTLWEGFEFDYPRLLGAVLNAISGGLRCRDEVELPGLPRMADFAHWGEAVCRGLGWEAGSFLARYKANRRAACASALGEFPVAEALQQTVDYYQGRLDETASDLLALIAPFAPQSTRKSAQRPKNPRALSVILRRITPQLRTVGINVEFGLGPNGRHISISSQSQERATRL
jgi:hypothetical protein